MLSKEEQLYQLIKNHQNKLLFTKNEINGDLFGSLLAWAFFLGTTNGKKFPTLYLPRFAELKKFYPFLPDYNLIIDQISGVRDFILSFNTSGNDIDNVRWRKENGHLDIIITPQKGSIDPADFSFLPAKFRYDLIMTLGTTDFNDLGDVYEKNSDLFFELPIINLDINPGNENYGQLNIIDTIPSSLAELSTDIMKKINQDAIKKEVAQCLLTGLIEATDNLKNPKVTPHTFDTAAFLMEQGGNHQTILNILYETESLGSLKLWGKLLERLKEEENIIWSYLNLEEVINFKFPHIMLRRFFVRLKNYLSLGNKKLLLLWQTDQEKICGFIHKIDRENGKDKKIIEELSGEIFNSEYLHFERTDEAREGFLALKDKIKNIL
ncbi:MAG: hypothetical protein FJZ04_00910 [Candidatus Moranbacteria bacterium]|nr:hypothetical protein [Candidatus Moranbacteria bacterium]